MRPSLVTLGFGNRSRRAWRRGLGISAIWIAALLAIDWTSFGRSLDFWLASRFEFAVRANLGKSPRLDPRLKIFGYDDQALAKFQNPDIALADWRTLIQAIEQRQPSAIVIDKIFGFLPPSERQAIPAARAAFAKSNVSVGAFAFDQPITGRDVLDLERPEFSMGELLAGHAPPTWLKEQNRFAYGPSPELSDAFRHIGHILTAGQGRLSPLIRLRDNKVIPQLALSTVKNFGVDAEGITVDDQQIALDRDGLLPVNFSTKQQYYQATYSMKQTLANARDGKALTQIKAGDTVLILPLFYTGNHDVYETPVGLLEGGFTHAAMLNSILSGNWLKPRGSPQVMIATAGLLGAVLGLVLNSWAFWPVFVVAAGGIAGSGVFAFAFSGFVVPWLFPLMAFGGTGLCGYAVTMSEWSRENRRLADALKGTIPEPKLKSILAGKGRVSLAASERIVTLVFLDIANFSVMAEQCPPKYVFTILKAILSDVTKTIHKYGGTVDKSLGDGMLAFFGYSYDGEVTENQADQALRCAIEIQERNMARCIEAGKAGEPVLPFRIGINTGSVYIGDVGNEDRIDFTVIGHGVNYAQRLEAACDHHAITLSATTMHFSAEFNPDLPGFRRRQIHMKHHDELLEAIEYDPFHDRPALREEGFRALRKGMNLERKEQRWPVDHPELLQVHTEFGVATLADFSAAGFCVKLDKFLAKGVTFKLTLTPADPAMLLTLQERGLTSLKVEVRWGKALDAGFAHGLKVVSLTDDQMSHLFSLLRVMLSRSAATAAASAQTG